MPHADVIDRAAACRIAMKLISGLDWGRGDAAAHKHEIRTWLLMYGQALTDLANRETQTLSDYLDAAIEQDRNA